MTIASIKKRDGRVVPFQRAKIRMAMEKAAGSVNEMDVRAYDLITDHVLRYIEKEFTDSMPDVESVQDLVERTLMEYGRYDVAKSYILYRAEHAKLRQGQANLAVAGVKPITYVSLEGKNKKLTKNSLRQRFDAVCSSFDEEIDVSTLVEQCWTSLYEGISELEINQAIVMTARSYIEKDPVYALLTAKLAQEDLCREVMGPHSVSQRSKKYREVFIANLRLAVEAKRLAPRMLDFDLNELADHLKIERDANIEYLGFQTLYDRYLLREEGGERKLETIQAFWMRVAMGLAMNELDKNTWAKRFYDVMSTLRYVPSTPTLFHAGTTFPQLSSCYLNTVDDHLAHIFKVYGDNAQLSKYSGGIGTDYSNIRATGALIQSTNVGSQGIIPFLKIANDVTVAINRSGKRRGATCAYLETWHYDIEDFLDLRRNTGDERRRTHDMNTANWIPDLFMKRVNQDGMWTLFSPDEVSDLHHLYGKKFEKAYEAYEKKAEEGKLRLFKRIPARDLWRKMITMLFETGHPWVTFKDACNVRSPQDHAGVIHSSNLCTEITLNTSLAETAVCNLGSINLAQHMKGGRLDEGKVAETVAVAMRALDNVVDLNFYPTEEAKWSNLKHRPVGLGIMGFQDALYMADITFDSEAAVEFADYSMEIISYHAIWGSAKLAEEKGAYASFAGSKWDRGIFPLDTLDLLEEERGMPIGVSRASRLDWGPVRRLVAKHGMRNSNTMAIAPTATISNISGCYPCIEPIYKNLYVKSNMSGEFTVVNKFLVNDLKQLGLWNESVAEELKRHDGSVQEITAIPPKLRHKYQDVFDIDNEWLIKAVAYRGKWIDQSQSFNVFFRGSSGKRLAELYQLAWHLGVKTTYYLRTMAATSIEKSTISLPDQHLNAEGKTLVEVELPQGTQIEPEAAAAIAAGGGPGPKVCSILDPDCEACQ